MALSDDSSVRKHSYAALEGPQHIRLIALHPALSKDAPLQVTFLSSDLKDPEGSYEAISYTWGQPILTFALHVDDGTQVCVTENLDRALRYLRYSDRNRLLWADAVCINQADDSEKSVQIPLMVDIFRGAQRVMAWLDPGGDTTVEQEGMSIMAHLSRATKTSEKASVQESDLGKVLRFLNLPWFNRLWVVQEIVFSLEISLICGETKLPFSRFIAALSNIAPLVPTFDPDDRARVEAIVDIGRLWNVHSLFGKSSTFEEENQLYGAENGMTNTTDILRLVERFASYGCTNPRDRIYALYNMATNTRPENFLQCLAETLGRDVDEADIALESVTAHNWPENVVYVGIDYSMDVQDTYGYFTISCCLCNKSDLIWDALLSRQHSSTLEDERWISWVPNWEVAPQRTMFFHKSPRMYPNMKFHPSGAMRISMAVPRYLGDGTGHGFYTVKAKTSRRASTCSVSFESQLLKLYGVLYKPGIVQKNIDSFRTITLTPQKLDLANFPNLLFDLIEDIIPRYKHTEEHFESMAELEQCFARMTAPETDGSDCKATSPSVAGEDIIKDLDQELGAADLFCFHDPWTQVHSVGYGNVLIEPGDVVMPVGSSHCSEESMQPSLALIFRLESPKSEDDFKEPVYNLVGSSYILNPTVVLLYIQNILDKIRRPRVAVPARLNGSEEEIYSDSFLASHGCKRIELSLYLV